MKQKKRPTYSAEFKLECAQRVLDKGYTYRAASEAMNISSSTLETLRIAWESRGRPSGLMFHSDQGSQYQSMRYRRLL